MSNRTKVVVVGVYIVLFALTVLISYRLGKRASDGWWQEQIPQEMRLLFTGKCTDKQP